MFPQHIQHALSLMPPSTFASGIYEHYKGNYYLVLFTCKHSETNEEMIIYQALYGNFRIWTRPLIMFTENITFNGQLQSRFKYVAEASEMKNYIQQKTAF